MWFTFEHELTHVIFCVLTLTKVQGFKASKDSDEDGTLGCVYHNRTGSVRSAIIALSPYFFPTYAVFLVLLHPLVKSDYTKWLDIAIGLSFGYHVISTWKEFGFFQSDIINEGKFFSTTLIIFLNIVITSCLFIIVYEGYASSWIYIKNPLVLIYDLVAPLI